MKVLCTRGYFDDSGEGCLVEADLATGSARVLLRYVPPGSLRVPTKGFAGACWMGTPGQSSLLLCGHAALFRLAPTLEVEEIWHQPCMNDLHHVAVSDGRVHVVNTGLESLDVFSLAGHFLGSHALHPGWVSAARQQGRVFTREELTQARSVQWPAMVAPRGDRSVADGYYGRSSEQPFCRGKLRDLYHPNHVAVVAGQVLITRLLDRTVYDAATFAPVIEGAPGLLHDGVLDEELFWLTCVNGLVLAYAVERGQVTGRLVRQLDLFATTGRTGWCRGLLVTPKHLIVGLTEIRQMPRQRWCDRPFEETETSVLCVDRQDGALLARVDLRDEARHTKLFSILPRGSEAAT